MKQIGSRSRTLSELVSRSLSDDIDYPPKPFILPSAFSASFRLSKLTNPNPLLSLVSRSRTTFALATLPNGSNNARRSSSSASTDSDVIRRVGRSSRWRYIDSPAPPPPRWPLLKSISAFIPSKGRKESSRGNVFPTYTTTRTKPSSRSQTSSCLRQCRTIFHTIPIDIVNGRQLVLVRALGGKVASFTASAYYSFSCDGFWASFDGLNWLSLAEHHLEL